MSEANATTNSARGAESREVHHPDARVGFDLRAE